MSDVKLIRACEDFISAYHRLVAAARAEDETSYYDACSSVDRLAVSITVRAPTTLSGIRAKARAAVLLWAGPRSDFIDEDDRTALARSLLTDLAGMPDSSSVVQFDPPSGPVVIRGRMERR